MRQININYKQMKILFQIYYSCCENYQNNPIKHLVLFEKEDQCYDLFRISINIALYNAPYRDWFLLYYNRFSTIIDFFRIFTTLFSYQTNCSLILNQFLLSGSPGTKYILPLPLCVTVQHIRIVIFSFAHVTMINVEFINCLSMHKITLYNIDKIRSRLCNGDARSLMNLDTSASHVH